MSKVYSGIGSRSADSEALALMTQIASYLKNHGYWCRTGGADGADLAFAKGAPDKTIVYLPWKSYNADKICKLVYTNDEPNCIVGCEEPSTEAIAIAKSLHPAPDKCSETVWKLHGRNCHIVNGRDLMNPSEFVVLWTPEGARSGGTALGWAYADFLKIPVFNLFGKTFKEFKFWYGGITGTTIASNI